MHAICYYGRSKHLNLLIDIVRKKKYDVVLTSKQEIAEQQLADDIIVKLKSQINQVDNSGMNPYRLAMADLPAAGKIQVSRREKLRCAALIRELEQLLSNDRE